MLLRVVHIPRLYTEVPADPVSAPYYCSTLLKILEDAERNCVLLVDNEGKIIHTIGRSIRNYSKWGTMHGKAAQKLLQRLERKNRLVQIDSPDGEDVSIFGSCGTIGCKQALSIAVNARPDMVITDSTCAYCEKLAIHDCWLTSLPNYAASTFCRNRAAAESIELADGEWNKEKFEREMWEPLFRYAKHVKIFDRMVGRHVTANQRDDIDLVVGEQFKRGLEWIFDQFLMHSSPRPSRRFEVTCGLDTTRLSQLRVEKASTALYGWADSLSQQYNFEFALTVKREETRAQLRHARFIFTDQLALAVERGFDLLRSDGLVRDVVIHHFGKDAEVEREARALTDIKRPFH